jgi:hypothetical protein
MLPLHHGYHQYDLLPISTRIEPERFTPIDRSCQIWPFEQRTIWPAFASDTNPNRDRGRQTIEPSTQERRSHPEVTQAKLSMNDDAPQRATVRPPKTAPRCHGLSCHRFTCGAGRIGKVGFPALTSGAYKCWRVAPEESNPFSRVIVMSRESRLLPNATTTPRSWNDYNNDGRYHFFAADRSIG